MICILSDTHDNERSTLLAVEMMLQYHPELVIHCGDISSPKMLDHFRGLPIRLVFGNTDWDRDGLRKRAHELDLEKIDYSLELSSLNRRIFVTHGDNAQLLDMAIASGSFDYVFHGHSHHLRDDREGKTRIINPGALQRAARHTFAVLDPESDELAIIEIPKEKM